MPLGPPNMASTVLRFSTPGTRRRPGAVTTNADGYRVAGPDVDTPGLGHLFPASGDLLQRFNLQDVAGLYELHTNVEMLQADRATGSRPDRWIATVSGRQRVLEVVRAGPWIETPAGVTTWWVAALQEVVDA